MTKTCSKCKETKPVAEYHKKSKSKDGLSFRCKLCKRKKAQSYYKKNKDKIIFKVKSYREKNTEAVSKTKKLYYKNNAEEQKKKQQDRRKKNPQIMKDWRNKNANLIRKYKRNYQRQRKKADPLYKLTHNIRTLIGNSISNGGYSKTSRTHEILGCSYEEYHQHIESQFTDGMSWERMSEIHIDHRLPVSAASTKAEMLVLNHHRNLQPLWAEDNLAKSDSYCPKELAAYFAKYL